MAVGTPNSGRGADAPYAEGAGAGAAALRGEAPLTVDAAGTGAAALIGEAAIPGAGAGVADVGVAPAEETCLMLHLLHLLESTQAADHSLLLALLMRTRHSRLGKSAGLIAKDERRARGIGSPAAGTGTGAAASCEATAGPVAGTSARAPVVMSWHESRYNWQCQILSMMLCRSECPQQG